MPQDKGNGVVTGSDAHVYMNGSELDDIKQFDYKVSLDFADVNYLGDNRTYKKYQGYSGEGTLAFNKTKSRGASLLKDAINTGIMPDVIIVAKIVNPSTGKSETATFSGITFSEFGGSFAGKSVAEESLPFAFSNLVFNELM